MYRNKLLVLIMCTACVSTADAQRNGFFNQLGQELRDQGRQFVEQELGHRFQNNLPQNQDRQQTMGGVLPSEGGQSSGGNGRVFNPGDGGFILPGNGGQPGGQVQPGFGQPGGQVQPGFGQPGGQIIYPGDQGQFPGAQIIYPGNQMQPGGHVIPGGMVGGTMHADPGMPSSPVMSSHYVLIRCPQSTTGSIQYTLSSSRGNFAFTMSGGQEQRFRAATAWSISYHDGTQQRRYKLEAGKAYTIKHDTANRWQLYAARSTGK